MESVQEEAEEQECSITFEFKDGIPHISNESGEPQEIGQLLFLIMETGFSLDMLSGIKNDCDQEFYRQILESYHEYSNVQQGLEKLYTDIARSAQPLVKPSNVFLPGIVFDGQEK